MTGTLYCVGVGPGDPELMTLKGLACIRRCPVIAVPNSGGGAGRARQILLAALEEQDIDISAKTMLDISFPMTRSKDVLEKAHASGAAAIEEYLNAGKDTALITLGCPTVYASSIYIHRLVRRHGYDTAIIPGVPSFCAAAARLQQPLCEQDEPLTIIPGNRKDRLELLSQPGNAVIMKPSGSLDALKEDLQKAGVLDTTSLIERCGLPEEQVFPQAAEAEDSPYFSILLVRKEEETE